MPAGVGLQGCKVQTLECMGLRIWDSGLGACVSLRKSLQRQGAEFGCLRPAEP